MSVLEVDNLYTCFSTVLLTCLKELRGDQKVPQAAMAAAASKSPSNWSKIESGQAPLTINAVYGVCDELRIRVSTLFDCAEGLAQDLMRADWHVGHQDLEHEEDRLLPLVMSFYKSKGYHNIDFNLYTPMRHINNAHRYKGPPAIVKYITDPKFRSKIDDPDQP